MIDASPTDIPGATGKRDTASPASVGRRDGHLPVRHRVPGDRRSRPPRGRPLNIGASPLNTDDRGSTGLRVRLYDADGRDREVLIKDRLASEIGDRQLLWIDLDGRDHEDLRAIATAVNIEPSLVRLLGTAPERADMTSYPEHVHLILQSMEPGAPAARDPRTLARKPIDLVAGRNWVVTVHDGPLRAFERIDASTEGDTRLGALDAAGFMASIADEVLADYLELAEGIEREIDQLDESALRQQGADDVLVSIVALRRRIGAIRRTLAPHRVAFAAFARPEMELYKELGKPWPGLTEHLDRTLEAIENLRELLLGTFEILMGRQGQSANEVMKVLTILSAVLLPAVVLAGVMGMNFQMDFFNDTNNFWVAIGAMVASAATILVIARWRHWI